MLLDRLERLRQQYVGKRVVVDSHRPELARFGQTPGRVFAVNGNGLVLVQFDGPDNSYHDIDPQFLKSDTLSY